MGNGTGCKVAIAAFVVLFAGCSGDDDDDAPSGWDSCEIDAQGCTCVIREGGSEQEFPPADDCSGYDCCLLSRSESSRVASCSCFDTSESCEDVAEASDKMVVAQCPPPGEALSERAMCIPEGAACPNRASVTESGCCEGLYCLSDGHDPPEVSCQPLKNREPAVVERCESATLSGQEAVEIVSGRVATSGGDVTFDHAAFGVSNVGEGGCLNAATLQLSAGTGCELLIDVLLWEGKWISRRVLASLDGCTGFSGEGGSFDVRETAEIPLTFSYTGEVCGAHDELSEHCVVGSFDWAIDGELNGLTFEGSHIVVKGVICGGKDDEACETVGAADAGL